MKSFLIAATLMALCSPVLAATYSPEDASSHIGQSITVEGVAYVHVKSTAAFLDMGGDFPNQAFQAVIFPNNQAAFGDLNRYNGKIVDVTGPVRDYKGTPEVILSNPGQLRLK